MRPRRTPASNKVYTLPGGTEDNDLWVEQSLSGDGHPMICSVWELSPEEREMVAAGGNIELAIYARVQPPVQLAVTDSPLGRGTCEHEWVDARNEVVVSGEVCRRCGAVRAGNDGASQG